MYILQEYNDISQEQMELDERTQFLEMGMDPISVIEDNLPFKIVAMNPDAGANKPHAHIYARGYGGKEIGTFVVTQRPPRCASDIIPYIAGKHKGLKNIPAQWLDMIVDWANKRNRFSPNLTNWQYLQNRIFANGYAYNNKAY